MRRSTVAGLAGLVLALFATFLLWPGSVLFSPHSDFIVVHFPARYLFSHSLRSYHQLPLWNPYQFCGSPLLGDWHCQWFYPPTWLYALVPPKETLRVYGFQVILHLIIGGMGMAHYLQGRGRSQLACLAGALIFMLNGKWMAHLLVAQHPILGWAWLPWCMASMDRLQKQVSGREVAVLSLLLSLLVQGSLPPFIAICAYFLISYGAMLMFAAPRPGPVLAALLGAGIWTVCLCLVALWPAAELTRLCTRGAGLTLAQASQGQVPWNILPLLPGWPTSPLQVGWEMTLFCGSAACTLAALACWGRPRGRDLFFVTTAGLVLLISLGNQTPLFEVLYRFLPGFSLFRHPARFGLLLAPAVAWLAAQQIDRPDPLPRPRLAAWGALWLVLAPLGTHFYGRVEGWFSLIPMALLGLTRWLPAPRQKQAIVLLVAAELGGFGWHLIDPRPLDQVMGQAHVAQQLAAPQGNQRCLVTISQMLTLPYATLHGVESSNGLTALVPSVTLEYLQQGVAQQPARPTDVLNGIPNLLPRSSNFLRRGNIARVLAAQPLPLDPPWPRQRSQPFVSYDFLSPDGFIQHPPLWISRNPRPLPRHRVVGKALACPNQANALEQARLHSPDELVAIEAPQAAPAMPQSGEVKCQYLNYQSRLLEVEISPGPGAYLVISEMFYPGWKLSEGLQQIPLVRADAYFLAAFLPPGSHQLRLDYAPNSLPRGLTLSLLSLMMALLKLVVSRIRNDRGE
jgi:hypothetical protein